MAKSGASRWGPGVAEAAPFWGRCRSHTRARLFLPAASGVVGKCAVPGNTAKTPGGRAVSGNTAKTPRGRGRLKLTWVLAMRRLLQPGQVPLARQDESGRKF